MATAGLVLAAGAGRRMGRPKAEVWVGGRRLVDRQVDLLRAAGCSPVLVVLGAAVVDVPDATTVLHPGWAGGMGSSLAAGLSALADGDPDESSVTAVVVVLVDQPRLRPEAVELTAGAVAGGARAARATYGGVPGHPVVLARRVWAEVATAAVGDAGARGWLADHAEEVVLVACDGLGDDRDVDTPADVEVWQGDGMVEVVIRRGVPADLPGVIDVYEAVAAEGLWIGGELPVEWTEERIEGWREQLSDDDETGATFVAIVADRVIGWIGLQRTRAGHADFGMAVVSGLRGAGVGGRLLDVAIDWAREVGAAKVTLQAWPHNTAAIRLYLSRGFVIEGRFRRHWPRRNGQRWDTLLMSLLLDHDSPGSGLPDSPLLADTPGAAWPVVKHEDEGPVQPRKP